MTTAEGTAIISIEPKQDEIRTSKNEKQSMKALLELERDGVYYIGGQPYLNQEALQARLNKIWSHYRCPNCGAFATEGKVCLRCARGIAQERLQCPHCYRQNTVKYGVPYGKQQWQCKDCRRMWIQDGVGSGNYERDTFVPRSKRRIEVGFGICVRCGRPDQILGDYLCCDCSDSLGETAHLYYRRKAQRICVFCGAPKLPDSIFCNTCRGESRQKTRLWMRNKRKRRGKR